jgi:hypothetical protein
VTEHIYFVFSAEQRSWRNRILQAEIQLQGDFPETHPHWWDGVPLTTPPPPLTFAVSAKGPMLDNYFTGTEFDLYSERLITLLREAGVQFETFPAMLVDRKTKEPLPVRYEVFHLLEVQPALEVYRAASGPPVIERLDLIADKWMKHKRPFFRAKEAQNIVLIHETLKQQFDTVGITGCKYTIPKEARSKPPWA